MTRSQGSTNLVEPLTVHRRAKRSPKNKKTRPVTMAEQVDQQGEREGPPPARNYPPAAGEGVANCGERRRTLRDYDTPSTHLRRGGIQQPAINRQEFEIKPGLLALVKQNQFHGLPSENPMYHLDTFEDICATTRVQGVPDEVIKSRLFTFSLCDKAHRWLKSLDPRTIQTWEQCKAAFLEQYFTQSRTSQLRNKISSFRQSGTESFGEAWERYKEYFRECPHHGFNQSCLLNTFYRGVDERYKMALDAASNGNFATNTEEEALIKIENLASSDNNHIPDYDRSARTTSTDSRRMEELMAKMEQLVKRGSKTVSFCDEQKNEDEEEVFQTELNYVNGQQPFNRGFNSYRNNNLSYRSNNVENPQDQYYPPQQRNQGYQQPFAQRQNNYGQGFQQRQQPSSGGAQKTYQQQSSQEVTNSQVEELKVMLRDFAANTTGEIARIGQDFKNWMVDVNARIETTQTHIKSVENQAKQIPQPQEVPESSKRNGKSICHFVEENNPSQNADDFEISMEELSWEGIDEILEIMDEDDRRKAGSDSGISQESDILPGTSQWEEAMSVEIGLTTESRPQPEILNEEVNGRQQPMEFQDILGALKREVGNSEVTADLKIYTKEIIDLVFGQKSIKETAEAITAAHRMKIAKLTARKAKDPGKFIIPASINDDNTRKGVCDLGSSISVISEKVCKDVGLHITTSLCTDITLADGSCKTSIGTAKDAIVRIGRIRIPTDFVVLRYKDEPPDDFILGRPFLKSGGALIDTLDDTIKFRVGKETVTFHMKKERERRKRKTAEDGRAEEPPDLPLLKNLHNPEEAVPTIFEPP